MKQYIVICKILASTQTSEILMFDLGAIKEIDPWEINFKEAILEVMYQPSHTLKIDSENYSSKEELAIMNILTGYSRTKQIFPAATVERPLKGEILGYVKILIV